MSNDDLRPISLSPTGTTPASILSPSTSVILRRKPKNLTVSRVREILRFSQDDNRQFSEPVLSALRSFGKLRMTRGGEGLRVTKTFYEFVDRYLTVAKKI